MTGSPIRLLVCDVDGTLVRHDKSLAPATVAAAGRLIEAGIAMTLISARPPSGMHGLAQALDLPGPFGAFNGGTLFGRDGTVSLSKRLDPETAAQMLDLIKEAGVEPWLFADGGWYAPRADNPHVARERLSSGTGPIVRADFTALTARIDKLVGVSDDATALKALEGKARTLVGRRATVALSQPYFLDITAPRANKGDGLAALAAAGGVPLANVAVIGDMPNDLPMFARAGLAIAMGQAPASVRDAAAFVTASNDEDGVAQAIDRLLDEWP